MASSRAMEVDSAVSGVPTAIQMKKEMISEQEASERQLLTSNLAPGPSHADTPADTPSPHALTELTAVPASAETETEDLPPPMSPVEAKHTAPLIQRDVPAPVQPAGRTDSDHPPPPAGEQEHGEEEQEPTSDDPLEAETLPRPHLLPAPPPPPLDKAELLNIVLSASRPVITPALVPERLQLKLPKEGFMCDQCGDRFLLASSLALHRARRTMQIFYQCPDCGRSRLFDNKCRFIEHLDSHGTSPDSLDPDTVDVSALSTQELSAPARVLPLGSRVLTGPPKMAQMVHKPCQQKPTYISCAMCNTLCTTTSLAEHMCPLTGPGSLEKLPPRCPECAQPCPSECALLAHHGLHKDNLFPYAFVCPECGMKVLGSHEEYRRHVVAQCLHLTRDLKNCCSICLIEVGDIRSHIQQTHTQKLYKCRKCPLAFESVNGFNGHVQMKHGNEQMFGETPYMPIIKCPFCAATFNHQKTLRDHLMAKKRCHQLELMRFVFRCPECDIDYGRKELLSDHLTQTHPDFQIADMDLADQEAEKQQEEKQKEKQPPVLVVETQKAQRQDRLPPIRPAGVRIGRPPKNTAFVAPVVPPDIIRSTDLVPMRRARVANRQLHSCIVCKSAFRRKSAYMEHARQHLSDGVPLCLLCNKAFDNEELLKHHIADHASEIGRDRCGLCYAKLGSRDQLQYHLEAEHNLRNFTCRICQLRFSRLNDLQRHNFAKHRTNGKGGRPPPRPAEPPVIMVPPPLQLPPIVDDEEDDDIPLSALGAKKPRITMPELENEVKPDVSKMAAQNAIPIVKRKRAAGAEKSSAKGGKRPRGDEPPMPRLKRANGRSETPEQRKSAAKQDKSGAKDKPRAKSAPAMYRCACCGFGANQRQQFLTHIVEHRQRGQHQCPECGQCYNTKPSLTKHLLLAHRLRNPPPELDELERKHEELKWEKLTKHAEPGQCGVCHARFADRRLLEKHVQSHGRAVIKGHRHRGEQQQKRKQRVAKPDTDGETVQDIAEFVAAGAGAAITQQQQPEDEEEDEGVIELEMKEGEITRRQLRRAGVPLQVRPDDSSDEEPAAEGGETVAQGNGADVQSQMDVRDSSIERELARMDGDGTEEKLAAMAAELNALSNEARASSATATASTTTANGHPQN